MDLLIFP